MLGDEKNEELVNLDEIDLAQTAILVIDELGDAEAAPEQTGILAATLNTARILPLARTAGVPVIYVNDAHIEGLDHELDLWGLHGLAGTPEAQTSPQLDPQEGDYTILKRRYSGFFQTGLRLLLDELGVRTLICTGMDTNICVRHTVADAYFNNYQIVVVGDATTTFLVGSQEEGLEYMKACYAAQIVTTDQVVARLGA
ncbi:MAG: isochorismatase family cysteine hydrolase [Coriobacteriia bacterium]|nr:isochorismatase family cysteine hydrolase [Coriobacteriia bacterium]